MSEQAQPVAVDQGNPNPQGIGANGKPVEKKVEISFVADVKTARRFARMAAVDGEMELANRISATVGDGPVTVSFMDKHPTMVGFGAGLATVAAGYGIYRGVKAYRNRSALTTASGGKVVRMAAR